MRIDQELKALFIEAYQAKLVWASTYIEMYSAMNRANGVGSYRGGENWWATDEYHQLRDEKEPSQKAKFNKALLELRRKANIIGLNEAEVLDALNDALKKVAEYYNFDFLTWRLTGNVKDDNRWVELNQKYRNTLILNFSIKDDKAALEIVETSLQIYIQSRKANKDDYFWNIDKFFGGHDRTTKLNAAIKLHNYDSSSSRKLQLTEKEFSALNQGNLLLAARDKLASINDKIEIINESSSIEITEEEMGHARSSESINVEENSSLLLS